MYNNVLFTKVSQFEFSSVIDEQILGLQVSVENFPPVTVGQASQDLEQKNLEKEISIVNKTNILQMLLLNFRVMNSIRSRFTI